MVPLAAPLSALPTHFPSEVDRCRGLHTGQGTYPGGLLGGWGRDFSSGDELPRLAGLCDLCVGHDHLLLVYHYCPRCGGVVKQNSTGCDEARIDRATCARPVRHMLRADATLPGTKQPSTLRPCPSGILTSQPRALAAGLPTHLALLPNAFNLEDSRTPQTHSTAFARRLLSSHASRLARSTRNSY